VAPAQQALARRVQQFLHRAGHINFGIAVPLKKTLQPLQPTRAKPPVAPAAPEPPAALAAAAGGGAAEAGQLEATPRGGSGEAALVVEAPSDEVVLRALDALLLSVDLAATTERQLKKLKKLSKGLHAALVKEKYSRVI
jgi:hypothetical protein